MIGPVRIPPRVAFNPESRQMISRHEKIERVADVGGRRQVFHHLHLPTVFFAS